MKKTEMKEKNESYCKKFFLDKEFAKTEVGKAAVSGGNGLGLLHSRIQEEVMHHTIFDKNIASLIAWDMIIAILAPDEPVPNNPSQLKRDMSCLWNGVYEGWYDELKPENEKTFKEWFICNVQIADAKKIGVKLDLMLN